MTLKRDWLVWLVCLVLAWVEGARGGEPVFDPSTLMRLVLVPADAATGSVIYRIRASDPDFDYPLHFELIGMLLMRLFLSDYLGTLAINDYIQKLYQQI